MLLIAPVPVCVFRKKLCIKNCWKYTAHLLARRGRMFPLFYYNSGKRNGKGCVEIFDSRGKGGGILSSRHYLDYSGKEGEEKLAKPNFLFSLPFYPSGPNSKLRKQQTSKKRQKKHFAFPLFCIAIPAWCQGDSPNSCFWDTFHLQVAPLLLYQNLV